MTFEADILVFITLLRDLNSVISIVMARNYFKCKFAFLLIHYYLVSTLLFGTI